MLMLMLMLLYSKPSMHDEIRYPTTLNVGIKVIKYWSDSIEADETSQYFFAILPWLVVVI